MCFHIYFIFPYNSSVKRLCDKTKIGELICELLESLIVSPETLPSPHLKKIFQHVL